MGPIADVMLDNGLTLALCKLLNAIGDSKTITGEEKEVCCVVDVDSEDQMKQIYSESSVKTMYSAYSVEKPALLSNNKIDMYHGRSFFHLLIQKLYSRFAIWVHRSAVVTI